MLQMDLLFFLLISACKFVGRLSYPTGAPLSACSSLTPIHKNILPQQSRPPYRIDVFQDKDRVIVKVLSEQDYKFQGFVLQARSGRNPEKQIEGTFTALNGVSKTINCFKGIKNTLTHVNAEEKDKIVTEWIPTFKVYEDVVFRATVAFKYDQFWTGVDSKPLRIRSDGNNAVNNVDNFGSKSSLYSGCYTTKGCFGFPSDCVARENCEIFLSFVDSGDGISFTMTKMTGISEDYMATGISKDTFMGTDLVTSCFPENGVVIALESWNERRTNIPFSRLEKGTYEWQLNNGILSCTWKRPYVTSIRGTVFDLFNSEYHILIAKGPVINGHISFHQENFLASGNLVNFTAYEAIESQGVHAAIKIHGTFMVTAWVGFVSLGILIARHFKSVWEKREICGVKVWFAFHRGLMILALGFAIIAFIVIFVYKNGWNDSTKNPHAILGCIATSLGIFQPIMAAFRPAVDDPKRPVFNWLHYAVGNIAQIIAVATIFFAKSLAGSGLKESFYWVMAVFVVVHCFFHFVFQLHSWTLQKRRSNEIKMLEMADGNTRRNTSDHREKAISGNVFRVLLLSIYGTFLAVIVLALYALIGSA